MSLFHHHHGVLPTWLLLILSCYPSLSAIALSKKVIFLLVSQNVCVHELVNIANEVTFTCLFYLDGLCDGRLVALQLPFCSLLPPGFVSIRAELVLLTIMSEHCQLWRKKPKVGYNIRLMGILPCVLSSLHTLYLQPPVEFKLSVLPWYRTFCWVKWLASLASKSLLSITLTRIIFNLPNSICFSS